MPVLQKLGVANTLTALLERTLKYGWPLVGTSLVSAITAWAAAATELLHPYAPLSWVAAGLVGGLIFVVLVWVGVAIRNAMISGNVRRRFYETGSRINPLEKIFENRRINIDDLMPPLGAQIRGKSFIDCELVGPANLVFSGQGSLENSDFTQSDAIIINNLDIPVLNGTEFNDCRFLRCKFFKVTLFAPEHSVGTFEKGFGIVKWLSDPRLTKKTS
jgi:hypothetical protein